MGLADGSRLPGATMKVACAVLLCFIGVLIFKDAKRSMSNDLSAPSQDERFTIIPGAEAIGGLVGRELAKAIARAAAKRAAGHRKNKRPSNKEKHQRGDRRRGRDQQRAGNKKQRGGKDGSRKRGGGI